MYNYKEEPKKYLQQCDHPNCALEGQHKAPKTRDASAQNPANYYWFCMAHIREYNKGWNYFDGMSQMEIEDFQKDATMGHRPTWKQQIPPNVTEEKMREKLGKEFGEEFFKNTGKTKEKRPRTSRKEEQYHETLELDSPTTKEKIKASYKKLAKKYHPDLNNNDKVAEDKFKEVTMAYTYLIEHYKKINDNDL